MKLSLSRCDSRKISWLVRDVSDRLRRIAAPMGDSKASVELILVDNDYIRQLNRQYRGVDRPTDVISFSYLEPDGSDISRDSLAGEIYISYEFLEKEAKELGVKPQHLFLRLGVHGLLHILGYGHGNDAEARGMEGEEKRLLRNHIDDSVIEVLF